MIRPLPVEGVEHSDGADVVNVPVGDEYEEGMLVVHDGEATPPVSPSRR